MPRARVRRPPTRFIATVLALVAVIALVEACSSSKNDSSTSNGGNGVEVKNFLFTPGTLTVPAGTKVTWTFDDSTQHAVHASDGSFQSAPLSGGQTYSFTFTKAGTYNYVCSIHPFIKGKVVVQ